MSENTKPASKKLFIAVLSRYILVFILLGLLFFTTAGTFRYMNGWLYIITMMIVMGAGFIVLYTKDKTLLEKRTKTSEKEKSQRIFIALSIILLTAMYALPGFDFRYGWTSVPLWLVLLSTLFLVIGYSMYIRVMLQNTYASRVVEIQEKQELIDTGLYSIVRHPMYLASVFIFVSSPLILGSFVAFIPGALFPLTFILRISNEEKVLLEGLDGYADYMKRVKYRLIPFIW
ncbi:MAG: isoprenylcysteine carboxylmethyltransferase family protein [Spirochaetes bacterium]|nr:isoprenylcysteine carboxylmethyltransferase family protein [Spirochaetota bacterium]MBU1079465.1 isoprenylcysteine carboxylmethyltransferase family protein [Spirochaetota bacterium]